MITNYSTVLLGVVLLVSFGVAAPRPAKSGDLMPIGVAKVDITPDTPVRMYGYAGRTTESEGIAGRLKATALALGGDEGEGPAVLLSVDCGAVPAEIHDAVLQRVQKACGLKSERFMLCNSHNHSGPDLKGMDSMTGTQHEHLVVVVDYARDCAANWTAAGCGSMPTPATCPATSYRTACSARAATRYTIPSARW